MEEGDSEQHAILSALVGRVIPDAKWRDIRPDEDESLQEIATGLVPRIAELQWELPVSIGLAEQSAAVACETAVVGYARAAREDMFGQPDPPFQSLGDGWAWLQQRVRAAGGEGRWWQQVWETLERNPGFSELSPELLQEVQRYPILAEWFEAVGFHVGAHFVWFPADQIESGDRGRLAPTLMRVSGLPLVRFCLPGEVAVPVCIEPLPILYVGAVRVATLVGCWSLGQATAHILTGFVPPLPRVRLWTSTSRGRAFIETFGAFSHREMRVLHRQLRANTGTFRKKGLTPRDVTIIDFVERTPGSWAYRLGAWNDLHPDAQYKRPNALQTAYTRALARRARP